MPDAVARLLSSFEVFNLNIAGLGLPLQCYSLGTFEQKLSFTMLAPVGLAVIIVLGSWATHPSTSAHCRKPSRSSRVRRMALRLQVNSDRLEASSLLRALPWLLTLSFLVFRDCQQLKHRTYQYAHRLIPSSSHALSAMVSSAAFSAFSCEEFDNGRSYLRADYSIECSTSRHTTAKDLAWMGILFYPVGMTLLCAVLLLRARRAIHTETPTHLSRALDFLVRDFEPDYYW